MPSGVTISPRRGSSPRRPPTGMLAKYRWVSMVLSLVVIALYVSVLFQVRPASNTQAHTAFSGCR
jgi:preprotein translocase subunit SecF